MRAWETPRLLPQRRGPLSLAVAAVSMLTGAARGGGGDEGQDWTARLMALPAGIWLVGAVGAPLRASGCPNSTARGW